MRRSRDSRRDGTEFVTGPPVNFRGLKELQRRKKPLSPEEAEYVRKVEAVIGYEVMLHLPLGSKFILGADDAEKIIIAISQ